MSSIPHLVVYVLLYDKDWNADNSFFITVFPELPSINQITEALKDSDLLPAQGISQEDYSKLITGRSVTEGNIKYWLMQKIFPDYNPATLKS